MENCSSWLCLSLAPGPLPKDNHFLSFLLILLDVSSILLTPCNSIRSGSAKFKAVPQIRDWFVCPVLARTWPFSSWFEGESMLQAARGRNKQKSKKKKKNLKAHISAFSLKGDFKKLSLKTYTCTFFAKTSSQPVRGWRCRTRASQLCANSSLCRTDRLLGDS